MKVTITHIRGDRHSKASAVTGVIGRSAPLARPDPLSTDRLRGVRAGVMVFSGNGIAPSVGIVLVVEHQRLGQGGDEEGTHVSGQRCRVCVIRRIGLACGPLLPGCRVHAARLIRLDTSPDATHGTQARHYAPQGADSEPRLGHHPRPVMRRRLMLVTLFAPVVSKEFGPKRVDRAPHLASERLDLALKVGQCHLKPLSLRCPTCS